MPKNLSEKRLLITESNLKEFVKTIKENVRTGIDIDVDSTEWQSYLERFFELVNY